MQIKEKLEKAIREKEQKIESLIWKGKNKIIDGKLVQNEIKMIDCTIDQLQGFYNHCETMLYNTNKNKPGRYVLKRNILEAINKCNIELFRRYMLSEYSSPQFKLYRYLSDHHSNDETVSSIFEDIPLEFKNISVNDLKVALIDKLGFFDKKPLTMTFILRQGIWLTPEEIKEIPGTNKIIESKKLLNLPKQARLIPDPQGLSFKELKALLTLKTDKYKNLTDYQLKLLRDKILFLLQINVDRHIAEWEGLQENINRVIEYKKQQEKS